MADEIGTAAARRKKLFVLARKIGLTRDERMEITKAMLWRDIVSWKDLDDAQVDRMLDALEGHIFVTWTLMNRAVQPSGSGIGPVPEPGQK